MDVKRQVPSAEFRVLSKKIKSVCSIVCLLGTIFIAGCGVARPGNIARVALLAPFEGRYQEIGYNAYYAVKLALADYGKTDIEFVALDDGGNVQSAIERARALAGDPLVKAVITLGYTATNTDVQQALGNVPTLIVGDWDAKPETSTTFVLTSPQIDGVTTLPQNTQDVTDAAQIHTPIVGNEILALEQFPLLASQPQQATVISSGSLPDTDFSERYINSAEYTPKPGLLATLTYDATIIVIQAITNTKNGDVASGVANIDYKGLNGEIQFKDGYWVDAPIHYFSYDTDGKLIPVDRPVK